MLDDGETSSETLIRDASVLRVQTCAKRQRARCRSCAEANRSEHSSRRAKRTRTRSSAHRGGPSAQMTSSIGSVQRIVFSYHRSRLTATLRLGGVPVTIKSGLDFKPPSLRRRLNSLGALIACGVSDHHDRLPWAALAPWLSRSLVPVRPILSMSRDSLQSCKAIAAPLAQLTRLDPTKTPLVLVACGSFSPITFRETTRIVLSLSPQSICGCSRWPATTLTRTRTLRLSEGS